VSTTDERTAGPAAGSEEDPYGAAADAAEGHVYTVTGQDWDSIVSEQAERGDERIVVNMGPQHPSTHGVLRLILELEGESVIEARCGVGYLHTGIEKNMEFRNWTQGVTFCTRMDYLSPLYQETTYCLGVERLLDIEAEIPGRKDASERDQPGAGKSGMGSDSGNRPEMDPSRSRPTREVPSPDDERQARTRP